MLTSLKLIIRPSTLSNYIVGTLCSLCIACSLNAAESSNEENSEALQVHGFIAQGVVNAHNSNYINADESLSLELTEVGINASYQLNEDFRLAGQAVYLNGGNRYHAGPRIDYLLLEWDAFHNEAWRASFYLGRVKNNHWLYSATRDIPFARPTIILPQSIYLDGFRDLGMGGDGGAIKISYSDDDFGEIDFNFSRGKSAISDEQSEVVIGKFALGNLDHDLDMQASVYWRPTFSQWRFGFSALDSSFAYDRAQVDNYFDSEFEFQFYTVNALYEGEFWQLSAEIAQQRYVTDGFYFPEFHRDNIAQGYYLQASYKVTKNLSVLTRHERFYANKDDKNGSELAEISGGSALSHFGFQNDNMLGLSYDFSSNFRINAEYHWMQGTARLSPIVQSDPIANANKNWQVWAVQFMYWF